jgi:predicted nucleic acid-binding protein
VIAALGSSAGGSSLIVSHQGNRYKCLVSDDVLAETLSNIDKLKLEREDVERWIRENKIIVTASPTAEEKTCFSDIIDDLKDRHLLASAKKHKVDILLSYDRKHVVVPQVKRHLRPIRVMTPKEFLKTRPI